MHDGSIYHSDDRVGHNKPGAGRAVCVGGHAVGAPTGAGEGAPPLRLAASLWSWFAGPYGDLPINYDGTYSADDVDAITDQWNRALYLQLCLAQAGAALCGQAGAPDLAQVGVSHAAR